LRQNAASFCQLRHIAYGFVTDFVYLSVYE